MLNAVIQTNVVIAVILVVCILIVSVLRTRHGVGLGLGKTISHDNLELRSETLGLVGRPDRIIQRGHYFIPEEKKSANAIYPSHRIQIGAYLLLIEDHFGVRPPYGIVVLGGGQRKKIYNSEKLRSWVRQTLSTVQQEKNQHPHNPLSPTGVTPLQCTKCLYRNACEVRLA